MPPKSLIDIQEITIQSIRCHYLCRFENQRTSKLSKLISEKDGGGRVEKYKTKTYSK